MTRKNFKKSACLAISCILVFLLSVPCFAASTRMTNIENASCNLVLKDGNAAASASVTGVRGTEKCKIVLRIQEQQGTNWVTVDICVVEEDRFIASASSSIEAKSGVTYRAQATVTVWANGISETKTINSK